MSETRTAEGIAEFTQALADRKYDRCAAVDYHEFRVSGSAFGREFSWGFNAKPRSCDRPALAVVIVRCPVHGRGRAPLCRKHLGEFRADPSQASCPIGGEPLTLIGES